MVAILNSAILNLAILESAILVFPLKLTHTCQDWFPPFAQKTFTHSFTLNLMIATILNSPNLAISHLAQKTSLIHSDLTWWWQPSWIPPSWFSFCIWNSAIFVLPLKYTHKHCQDWFPPFHKKNFNSNSFIHWTWWSAILNSPTCLHHLHKKTSLIHSDSTWWWWPSWI